MSSDLIGTKRLFSNASTVKIVGANADQVQQEPEIEHSQVQKRPKLTNSIAEEEG